VIVDDLRDAEYLKVSKLVEGRPDVELRVIGDIRNLDFLKHFPGLRFLEIDDAPELNDTSGLRYLSNDLESLAIGARLSRKPSVRVLIFISTTYGPATFVDDQLEDGSARGGPLLLSFPCHAQGVAGVGPDCQVPGSAPTKVLTTGTP